MYMCMHIQQFTCMLACKWAYTVQKLISGISLNCSSPYSFGQGHSFYPRAHSVSRLTIHRAAETLRGRTPTLIMYYSWSGNLKSTHHPCVGSVSFIEPSSQPTIFSYHKNLCFSLLYEMYLLSRIFCMSTYTQCWGVINTAPWCTSINLRCISIEDIIPECMSNMFLKLLFQAFYVTRPREMAGHNQKGKVH